MSSTHIVVSSTTNIMLYLIFLVLGTISFHMCSIANHQSDIARVMRSSEPVRVRCDCSR